MQCGDRGGGGVAQHRLIRDIQEVHDLMRGNDKQSNLKNQSSLEPAKKL